MWVGWYTTHGTKRRSTLDNETPVGTLGEKNGKRRSLTKCLCNVAHASSVNQQDKKFQIKERRRAFLDISVHCYYCNTLTLSGTEISSSLGFRNDVVDPLPVAWDEFGATVCRSTCMEDEYQIGCGVVGPQRR